MSHSHDELDITLLRADPNAFILQCQNIINIFVKKYIGSGMFNGDDKDDIVQSINEVLIKKIPVIRSRYNGQVLLQTYISAIIQNICLDIYKSTRSHFEQSPFPEKNQTLYDHPEKNLLIEEEVKRFQRILDIYRKQKYKILFCLKIQYRLPILQEDIRSCFPNGNGALTEYILSQFNGNYDDMKVEEIFGIVAGLFNNAGSKKTKWDSLRRWTQQKEAELIRLLNGYPPQRAHNAESLKILVEKYSLSNQKI